MDALNLAAAARLSGRVNDREGAHGIPRVDGQIRGVTAVQRNGELPVEVDLTGGERGHGFAVGTDLQPPGIPRLVAELSDKGGSPSMPSETNAARDPSTRTRGPGAAATDEALR